MNVKGSVLRGRLVFIKEHGEQAYTEFMAYLSEEIKTEVGFGFMPSSWYPANMLTELTGAIDNVVGNGDKNLAYDMGYHSCEANLTTLYRIFFRLGNVHYIIKRAAEAWRIHYDIGIMNVINETPTSTLIELREIPNMDRLLCEAVRGWITRAAELSGCKNVTSSQPECATHGDGRCTFQIAWD